LEPPSMPNGPVVIVASVDDSDSFPQSPRRPTGKSALAPDSPSIVEPLVVGADEAPLSPGPVAEVFGEIVTALPGLEEAADAGEGPPNVEAEPPDNGGETQTQPEVEAAAQDQNAVVLPELEPGAREVAEEVADGEEVAADTFAADEQSRDGEVAAPAEMEDDGFAIPGIGAVTGAIADEFAAQPAEGETAPLAVQEGNGFVLPDLEAIAGEVVGKVADGEEVGPDTFAVDEPPKDGEVAAPERTEDDAFALPGFGAVTGAIADEFAAQPAEDDTTPLAGQVGTELVLPDLEAFTGDVIGEVAATAADGEEVAPDTFAADEPTKDGEVAAPAGMEDDAFAFPDVEAPAGAIADEIVAQPREGEAPPLTVQEGNALVLPDFEAVDRTSGG
jgi:hypothetical protein